MRWGKFFSDGVGATAACALRLIEGSEYCGQMCKERQIAKEDCKRHVVVGDSWFGSVALAETMKCIYRDANDNSFVIKKDRGQNPKTHELIAAIKTNTTFYPKDEFQTKMKGWPSGSYLVLECKPPEKGVDLVALGYKYNASKVLTFIMTKNAGSTTPGTNPYHAKFPDKFGNPHERIVQRPDVLGKYFDASDVIDNHNHMRQHRLALEQLWATKNPWFRIDTTFIGYTVIDPFRGLQYHSTITKGMTTQDFAEELAYDCVHNQHPNDIIEDSAPATYIAPTNESCNSFKPPNEINRKDKLRL